MTFNILETKDLTYKKSAIQSLQESLNAWQRYAAILDRQYDKMNISIQRVFDWHKIEEEVIADINRARHAR